MEPALANHAPLEHFPLLQEHLPVLLAPAATQLLILDQLLVMLFVEMVYSLLEELNAKHVLRQRYPLVSLVGVLLVAQELNLIVTKLLVLLAQQIHSPMILVFVNSVQRVNTLLERELPLVALALAVVNIILMTVIVIYV